MHRHSCVRKRPVDDLVIGHDAAFAEHSEFHAHCTAPLLQRPRRLHLAAQSAEQLSLAAVQTLPFLLLSIPMGLLADRLPRRQVMIASEALRALSLLVLLAMVASGQIGIVWLAVLGFVGAVGTVGFTVAG